MSNSSFKICHRRDGDLRRRLRGGQGVLLGGSRKEHSTKPIMAVYFEIMFLESQCTYSNSVSS